VSGRYSLVEKLSADHEVAGFDCGILPLDTWLVRFALVNQVAGTAQTYVIHRAKRVVGYYALAAGSVTHDESPGRISKGLARHPIPVVTIARLAVDRKEQDKGLGSALLKDALFRIADAAEIVGVRAVLIHAKHGKARSFYERFDFIPSPADPLQMFLLMKDLKRALDSE
jgi:GNAT superfamily N-acetyltransferase